MARQRHRGRWLFAGLVVGILAVGAYAAWLAWGTAQALDAASDDAQAAQDAVAAGDPAGTRQALDSFSDHAATAASRTGSPVWSIVTHLPVIGDDARGVRTVSQVADDLSGTGLEQLTAAADNLDRVLPRNGRIDVDAVTALQAPVADGSKALDRAKTALAADDPEDFVGPLATRYRDLQDKVDSAARAMGVADKALAVLPTMLGADGPRNYLLVFQNNAEIRATGGLPGSVSLLNVDNGALTLTKQRSGSSFPETAQPVLPLSDAEVELFGDNLGRYFVDANLTPDFPRASALWQAHWQQVEGDQIDGVVSLDTVSLSYLLRALGPVEVDGVQLTADNVVQELLSTVYARLPEPADQDVFFRNVAATVFAKVTTFSGSTRELLSALDQSASERRLLIHDFDDQTQAELAGTPVASDFTGTPQADREIGFYFADGTLSKMSYYLRYDVKVTGTTCEGGVQTVSGTLTLTSTAPADAKTSLPPYVTGSGLPARSAGKQLVVLQLAGPKGASVDPFNDDQISFNQFVKDLDGRPVRTTYTLLDPGESATVDWSVTTAEGVDERLSLTATPSVVPGNTATQAPAC